MRSLAPPKCILGRGAQLIKLNLIQKISIFDELLYALRLSWQVHRGSVGKPAHTIIASFAKLLSRGLRPIFGGGVRNNCNAIFTSNGLWMISMMSIVLARVCDLPRQGCVSMCMNQWWTHSHCIHTHHNADTTNVVIMRVSHVWPYST